MVLASNAWCFSTLLLLLSAGSTRAAECTALTENVLTSSGCPSDCDNNPCVLYSPSLDDSCIELGASGPCYSDSAFTLPGASTECNVTYQCLDSLLWDGNQWLLALEANAATDSKTMAYVTQITDLTYSASTLSVQLQGTPTESTNKNNIKDISLDQTFFDTPSTVVSMFLLDVNLRNTISSVSLATSYQTLYLTNDNLNAIPDQFANFTAVAKLDLSFNYITELPDNTSDVWAGLSTVTDLNLAENELTDFPVVLSNLQTLNLTGNAYTTIPDNIYTMAESGALKYLYMANCNLTNLQVSASQLALLENLATFDADVAITDCGSGYSATTLTNADAQVCTVSTSSSNDDDGGGHTLAIALGVCCGVLVLLSSPSYGTARNTVASSALLRVARRSSARTSDRVSLAATRRSDRRFGTIRICWLHASNTAMWRLDSCPPSIVKLARACLSFDPAQRPSAIHISYELRKIMKDEL
ncbi:Leucine-rich repeat domain, L domain-like [Phytophthora cactorum]|nr:Leucine-rich repeat domain, L domain-like [Phytophthora cactorum]